MLALWLSTSELQTYEFVAETATSNLFSSATSSKLRHSVIIESNFSISARHASSETVSALKNALKNLTAEQAAWKTKNQENSIWETLSHLNFYNGAY